VFFVSLADVPRGNNPTKGAELVTFAANPSVAAGDSHLDFYVCDEESFRFTAPLLLRGAAEQWLAGAAREGNESLTFWALLTVTRLFMLFRHDRRNTGKAERCVSNPQNITVRSNFGGQATRAVTAR